MSFITFAKSITIITMLVISSFFLFESYSTFDDVRSKQVVSSKIDADYFLKGIEKFSKSEYRDAGFDVNNLIIIGLEASVINNRNERAIAALLARTWFDFIGVTFGAVTIIIGATYLLSEIKITPSTAETKIASLELSVKSSSAGIFLITVGAVLVALVELTPNRIEIDDTGTYVAKQALTEVRMGSDSIKPETQNKTTIIPNTVDMLQKSTEQVPPVVQYDPIDPNYPPGSGRGGGSTYDHVPFPRPDQIQ